MAQIVIPSLLGTENVQTQNLTVLASSVSGTTVQLGVPPSSASPTVTIVSPANGADLDLINGALGIIGTSVVSGAAVQTVAATGTIKASYAGGYWIIS
jgi:hypothetical protein